MPNLSQVIKKKFQKAEYLGRSFWSSMKREGFYNSGLRFVNYVIHGKGVVDYNPKYIEKEEERVVNLVKLLKVVTHANGLNHANKYANDANLYANNLNKAFDVIIPVYNGIEFLPKLFESIFKNTKIPYRLIIIDDASSDIKVSKFLEGIHANGANRYANKINKDNQCQKIILKRNKNNLGFVKTVNKGMKLAKNHFVLLNTDVEVPPGWLERLMKPIVTNKKVASTTPFTNSGLVCSFPQMHEDNELFMNLSLEKIDGYFQKINLENNLIEMPTGIGFCMGMNKKVVEEIGDFDAETFSRGYGEENDWCQRAIERGYKNVMVPNLFVYHKHKGSFSAEEKKLLGQKNLEKLLKKHPEYNQDIQKFIARDPAQDIRNFLIMLISADTNSKDKPTLFFDHDLGGGANYYRQSYLKKNIKEGRKIFVFIYSNKDDRYYLRYYYQDYKISYFFDKFEDVFEILKLVNLGNIIVSQVVSYKNALQALENIVKIQKMKKCFLTVLNHDYFLICPSVVLVNNKKKYCGIPDVKVCEKCLAEIPNEFNISLGDRDIHQWRKAWLKFYQFTSVIVCFSNSSQELILKAYPTIKKSKIKIIPHKVDYLKPVEIEKKDKKAELVIGILGGVSYIKGSGIIREMIKIIEEKNKKVKIVVIGELTVNLKSLHLVVHGKYKRSEIPKLSKKYKVDLFFIPSIVPETFSYTTQEIINMGYPVAVFDLGAQAERIKDYKRGLLISKINAKLALKMILEFGLKDRNT